MAFFRLIEVEYDWNMYNMYNMCFGCRIILGFRIIPHPIWRVRFFLLWNFVSDPSPKSVRFSTTEQSEANKKSELK